MIWGNVSIFTSFVGIFEGAFSQKLKNNGNVMFRARKSTYIFLAK